MQREKKERKRDAAREEKMGRGSLANDTTRGKYGL